jgi:hypothetical protein
MHYFGHSILLIEHFLSFLVVKKNHKTLNLNAVKFLSKNRLTLKNELIKTQKVFVCIFWNVFIDTEQKNIFSSFWLVKGNPETLYLNVFVYSEQNNTLSSFCFVKKPLNLENKLIMTQKVFAWMF